MMSDTTSPGKIHVAEIGGRGRALISSQPLKAGEIVLKDSPILLYSAFPLFPSSADQENNYCSHCFRLIAGLQSSSAVYSCPCCSLSSFCSPNCRCAALSSSHTPWVCESLKRLRDAANSPVFLSPDTKDRQVQYRFLVAAYNLAVICPSDFQILLSLQGDHTSHHDDTPLFLHSLISFMCPPNQSQIGFSVELTAALLAKDKLNAFGLMEPFAPDKDKSVRSYGIYPRASFFNHDCLPNACRFDYVDSTTPPGNTVIIVRLIHDVRQGREICLSYFPVNLKYSERQSRLKEDYGFTCQCDRCRVEANWSDHEDDMEDVEEDATMEEDYDFDHDNSDMTTTNADKAESSDAVEAECDFPHAYFFLRYMCNRDDCGGTLAPLPPSDTTSSLTLMECNVCGNLSNCDELAGGNALQRQ